VIDPTAAGRLQEVLRRESRSFLQYAAAAADPYLTGPDHDAFDTVRILAREEEGSLRGLAEFLHARRVPLPHLGAFPMTFANYNFLAMRFLLPKLVGYTRRELEQLETEGGAVGNGEARKAIEALTASKRQRLSRLEELTKAAI
jgi:hypothetical protein